MRGTDTYHRASYYRYSRYRYLIYAVAVLVLLFSSEVMSQQADKPDCKCRAPGGELRDLGTVECVDIVGERHLVICEMSTNTPYWRKLEHTEGCPSA